MAPVRLARGQRLRRPGRLGGVPSSRRSAAETATLWLRAPGEAWRALGRSPRFARPGDGLDGAAPERSLRPADQRRPLAPTPCWCASGCRCSSARSGSPRTIRPTSVWRTSRSPPAATRCSCRRAPGSRPGARRPRRWRAPPGSAGHAAESLQVTGGPASPGASSPPRPASTAWPSSRRAARRSAGDTVRLPIRLVADSAPAVEVPVPGADTLAPLSLQVPLVIDARDDHGLTPSTLESRRISRLGLVDSARRESRRRCPPERPDRAILTYTLDLNRRGLLPGDTVRYFAIATDNTPGAQAGRSREYVLRLPTMSEVRAAQRAGHRRPSPGAARFRHRGEQAARAADRGPGAGAAARPAGGRRRAGESLSFEEAKRAEAVARSQQELIRQAEELKQSLEALQKSAEAAGVTDSAWQRQLPRSASSSSGRSRPSCASSSPRCSRRSRTSTPSAPRTRSSGWRRRRRSCARRWSGAASCSSAPRWRATWPT